MKQMVGVMGEVTPGHTVKMEWVVGGDGEWERVHEVVVTQ